MPDKTIDLTGFTLTVGGGECEIGLADKKTDYTLSDEVVGVIQDEIQKEKYGVELNADTDKGLLTLIIGKAAKAIDILISFILTTIRESGYLVAA